MVGASDGFVEAPQLEQKRPAVGVAAPQRVHVSMVRMCWLETPFLAWS